MEYADGLFALPSLFGSAIPVCWSFGLGVESAAGVVRTLLDPGFRPPQLREDLSNLIVMVAQTGDEWTSTCDLVAEHVLPLLAARRVRLVEVARAGPKVADGIVVLQDTRTPTRLHPDADEHGFYALSAEHRGNGVMPTLAGRSCSAKAKGQPLDAWRATHLGHLPYTHAVGFNYNETRRIERDTSVTMSGRRNPIYPLHAAGWSRERAQGYLYGLFGVWWPKSCCRQCFMWNMSGLRWHLMITVSWEHFPLVEQHDEARRWLQFTANLGRAPNTVDAYGRAVQDHLAFCLLAGADPATARADLVAAWIGDMLERPNPRSGAIGLANSTIQQRVVAVRGFYDFLVEEEIRERNPVRRGQAGRGGRRPRQGLVRRVEKAPWIPNEDAWDQILSACESEPLRNRLMVTVAYDGALRREELVSLEIGDLEPAWSLIHLRAETTKSKRAREVTFGSVSAQLLVAYLRQRGEQFGRVDGALFLSQSRRNRGKPLGLSSWSKIVTGIAQRAHVPQLSTHTFRHLRLTDLARAEWTIDEIAQYAGHRDLSTTLKYIHLSGRELAAKMHKATRSLHADRERRLAALAEVW
jgi:site-specific recombinase XerD